MSVFAVWFGECADCHSTIEAPTRKLLVGEMTEAGWLRLRKNGKRVDVCPDCADLDYCGDTRLRYEDCPYCGGDRCSLCPTARAGSRCSHGPYERHDGLRDADKTGAPS